jgi:hypothetical protein
MENLTTTTAAAAAVQFHLVLHAGQKLMMGSMFRLCFYDLNLSWQTCLLHQPWCQKMLQTDSLAVVELLPSL